MGMKCIGIDVGGTTVKVGLFETDGTLLDKWEVKSRKEEDGKYILPDVAASIDLPGRTAPGLREPRQRHPDLLQRGLRKGSAGHERPGR